MKTLALVVEALQTGESFAVALGDFLDAFYRAPSAACLDDEPPAVPATAGDSEALDAYLAAVAEHLARQYRLAIPAWVFAPGRRLHRPRFGSPAAALRATLLLESPPAFRSRNLFVTANALDRASRHSSAAKSPEAA
ncbi:MAG: hypothetical protein HY343_07160 [Lentisphaerae bacterium]|nr:hypothetical protein [Lentisphaerota bacterium]